jgi:signal transduction histidine kinase
MARARTHPIGRRAHERIELDLSLAERFPRKYAGGAVGPEGHRLVTVEAIPIRRAPTDMRALLPTALRALRRQSEQYDVALKIEVSDRLPGLVSLDADKIAWTVTVLVGNALRFVRHGSQTMPGGSIAVRVRYDVAQREMTIEVEDDGPGIAKEVQPLLFTDRPNRAPVGLGLRMVREVVMAHGGRMDVESDPSALGPGTAVRLTLPVS